MADRGKQQVDAAAHGAASYEEWRRHLREDAEYGAVYEEEAAKGELWVQLVEARRAAGSASKNLRVGWVCRRRKWPK